MARRSKHNREFWQKHVLLASQHAEGSVGYCREHGLDVVQLYKWRSQLKKVSRPLKPFARVEVVDLKPKLPEAKWVAEFVHHFLRGAK